MNDVLSVYVRILLEFLFELYVFYFLVTRKLHHARGFAWKFFVGLAAVAALALGVAWFYLYYGQTVWGRIVVYIFLFGVTTVHLKFCFDESYKTVLFCCSLAYAAQNLVYKLFLMLWCFVEQLRWLDGWGASFELYYRIFYYTFFAAATALTYFLLIRWLINRLPNRKLNFRLLAISLMVLGVTVILCSFEDVYFAELSVVRENRFDVPEYYVLRQTGNAFSVVCCAIVLMLITRTIEQRDLKQEVEYLQYAIRQSERQYEISRDTIDMINVKCHDIKYKVDSLLMQRKELAPELMKDLQESISIYDTKTETGNRLLNVLLTEKSLYCEQNGITFSCMADGDKLSFMDDGDLYCLFGNMIDNALEAVKAIAEKERRVINLVVKVKNGLLIIQEDNYFDGELNFRDGLPVTTKQNKNYHGFGTRSIRMIVHKYEGELTTYVTDDIFHMNIIFSLNGDRK